MVLTRQARRADPPETTTRPAVAPMAVASWTIIASSPGEPVIHCADDLPVTLSGRYAKQPALELVARMRSSGTREIGQEDRSRVTWCGLGSEPVDLADRSPQ
jgi:hypothetical protein